MIASCITPIQIAVRGRPVPMNSTKALSHIGRSSAAATSRRKLGTAGSQRSP